LAINTAGKIEILLRISEQYYSSVHDDVATAVLPHINQLLVKANAKVEDIDVFGVCIGPGSFTGIRVGLSTIKALAYALNKPVILVTYFDILAYDYNGGKKDLTAIIDGKNNVSYIKNYDGEAADHKGICRMSSSSEGVCIRNEDIKSYALKNIVYDIQYSGRGLKAIMEEKIRLKDFANHNQVTPLYLRKSQPERQDGEI